MGLNENAFGKFLKQLGGHRLRWLAAQSIVEFQFSDIVGYTDKRQDEKPLSRMTISYTRESGFRLDQSQKTLYRGQNKASLALALEQRTLHQLMDKNTTGLAIHAAAVNSGDQGILIPGISGAGKSTLAFWLTARGFNYLTDELVNVPLGT